MTEPLTRCPSHGRLGHASRDRAFVHALRYSAFDRMTKRIPDRVHARAGCEQAVARH